MVLGTAGYMSPEQVRGKEVDARTDIFAFGAILYEMLSGQRAFKGESSVETMNAILKEDPPELETEKLKRVAGTGANRAALPGEGAGTPIPLGARRGICAGGDLGDLEHQPVSERGGLPPERRGWLQVAALVLLLVVAAVLAAYYLGRGHAVSSSTSAYRQLTFEPGYAGPARFTRDGNTVVYSAAWNGGAKQLYSQRAATAAGNVTQCRCRRARASPTTATWQ